MCLYGSGASSSCVSCSFWNNRRLNTFTLFELNCVGLFFGIKQAVTFASFYFCFTLLQIRYSMLFFSSPGNKFCTSWSYLHGFSLIQVPGHLPRVFFDFKPTYDFLQHILCSGVCYLWWCFFFFFFSHSFVPRLGVSSLRGLACFSTADHDVFVPRRSAFEQDVEHGNTDGLGDCQSKQTLFTLIFPLLFHTPPPPSPQPPLLFSLLAPSSFSSQLSVSSFSTITSFLSHLFLPSLF